MRLIIIAVLVLGCFWGVFVLKGAVADEQLAPPDAANRIKAGAVVIDVRTAEEFATGHVKGALNIPHTEIGSRLSELAQYKDKEVLLYCRSGRRSELAQRELTSSGFKSAQNAGGFADLQAAGVKVE